MIPFILLQRNSSSDLFPGIYTSGSLNPSRSFGPAVADTSFPSYHRIEWVDPFLRAAVDAGRYQFLDPSTTRKQNLCRTLQVTTSVNKDRQDAATPTFPYYNFDVSSYTRSDIGSMPCFRHYIPYCRRWCLGLVVKIRTVQEASRHHNLQF